MLDQLSQNAIRSSWRSRVRLRSSRKISNCGASGGSALAGFTTAASERDATERSLRELLFTEVRRS